MEKSDYSDIIDLPRHVSGTHPHMSMMNRAAQFAPFAALTGFGAEITEAARLTERRIELSESEMDALNEKLRRLSCRLPAACEITHFLADERKDGGRYANERVTVRRVLPDQCRIVLDDGRSVDLDNLLDVTLEDDGERRTGVTDN